MSTIEKIKERLAKYPDLVYSIRGDSITIDAPSPTGFAVSLTEASAGWVVHFDGWHEHFSVEDEALDCFAFGLLDDCRLEIAIRGNFPYRWTLQHKTASGWKYDSTTGLFIFPFWRPKRIEYRQNNLVDFSVNSVSFC